MIIHVLFGTYRFGVDNKTWNDFDSLFGVPMRKRFIPKEIILRYRTMRARALCGFIPYDDAKKLFPRYLRKL